MEQKPNQYHLLGILVTGAAVAACTWRLGESTVQILWSWFIPFLWLLCTKRTQAFMLIASYYFFAWLDLPVAAARVTDLSPWMCSLILAGYASSVALLWSIAWASNRHKRCLGLCTLILITNLPPLAAFTAPSPLLCAGLLYPSMGWMGLVLTMASWPCLAACLWALESLHMNGHMPPRTHLVAFSTLVCLSVAIAMNAKWLNQEVPPPLTVHSVVTHLPRYPRATREHYNRQLDLVNLASKSLRETPANLTVFSEGVGGLWQPNVRWMWQNLSQSQTTQQSLIVGFNLSELDGSQSNGAVIFNKDTATTVRARIPMPVGNWQPWRSNEHMPIHWFESAITQVQGTNVAVIFCYEELVMWPWLVTAWQAANKPLQVVVLANQWFAHGLNSNLAQQLASQAQARLWGWSITRSVNLPAGQSVTSP